LALAGDFGSGAAIGAGAAAAGAAQPQVGSTAAQQVGSQQLLLPQHDFLQRLNSLQRFLPQQLTFSPQHGAGSQHFGSQQALLPQQADLPQHLLRLSRPFRKPPRLPQQGLPQQAGSQAGLQQVGSQAGLQQAG